MKTNFNGIYPLITGSLVLAALAAASETAEPGGNAASATAEGAEPASLETPRRFFQWIPSRNLISNRILQRNTGGSRARS